jgi:hypothetical protein
MLCSLPGAPMSRTMDSLRTGLLSRNKRESLSGPWPDVGSKGQRVAGIRLERIRIIRQGTHETSPSVYFPSGTIGFPSSSKHFEMSNVARVEATVKNKIRKAKNLPGQILENPHVIRWTGVRR